LPSPTVTVIVHPAVTANAKAFEARIGHLFHLVSAYIDSPRGELRVSRRRSASAYTATSATQRNRVKELKARPTDPERVIHG
jgi:hypothetical protein